MTKDETTKGRINQGPNISRAERGKADTTRNYLEQRTEVQLLFFKFHSNYNSEMQSIKSLSFGWHFYRELFHAYNIGKKGFWIYSTNILIENNNRKYSVKILTSNNS